MTERGARSLSRHDDLAEPIRQARAMLQMLRDRRPETCGRLLAR